ncbi:unnamed protein product [Gadus morhua 'NCC']
MRPKPSTRACGWMGSHRGHLSYERTWKVQGDLGRERGGFKMKRGTTDPDAAHEHAATLITAGPPGTRGAGAPPESCAAALRPRYTVL